jgi:hypothetical protein
MDLLRAAYFQHGFALLDGVSIDVLYSRQIHNRVGYLRNQLNTDVDS